MNTYLSASNSQIKFNIKSADTCFDLEDISVLTGVFKNLVFPVKNKAMKR